MNIIRTMMPKNMLMVGTGVLQKAKVFGSWPAGKCGKSGGGSW
jgi:hypothetical protein